MRTFHSFHIFALLVHLTLLHLCATSKNNLAYALSSPNSTSFSSHEASPSTTPVAMQSSSSLLNNPSLISSSTLLSSPSSSASGDEPTPTPSTPADDSEAEDIQTLINRRISVIIESASSPSGISSWMASLQPNGNWPDSEVDYTSGCPARRANWPAQEHWQRIPTMSAAWYGGVPGGDEFVKDPSLLNAISSAMDYWFANDFTNNNCLASGGTSLCPCDTPGLWNTNWFSNIILIPNLVSQSCLLLNNSLTASQVNGFIRITERAYNTLDSPINGLGIATGANLLDIAKIGIDLGLTTLNGTLITDAFDRIHGGIVIENDIAADGIRADGSFGQHGGLIYNGNYGKDFSNDVLALEIEAGGTQFSAPQVSRDAFSTLIEGDLWMIFRNVVTGVLHWDFSVLGRFISFPVADSQATASINLNLTQIKQLGEDWDSETLKSAYQTLSKNTTNANVGSVKGNRMFYTNDYMVQRGPRYVTTLKMFSNRTKNTECINLQNPLGFHLSDGTTYTYLKGNEYEDIAAAWDWNLIPGTTVDYGNTPLNCDQASFKGLEAFVGGVSDGKIGLAAMRYSNPLTRALSWQKAWFFLNDDTQHVMLSNLDSSSSSPVYSVLDQKRHSGPVFVNGTPVEGSTNISEPVSLWHDNVGYDFSCSPSTVPLSLEVGPKTGSWSAIGISTQPDPTVDLFAAWLDHGLTNNPPPISYTAFPGVAYDEFLAKSSSTRLQSIQNDAHISAVYDTAHDTAMMVFWDVEGGSIQFTSSPNTEITVTSDGNAAVLFDTRTGIVTVSDPSQSLSSLKLTITENKAGVLAKSGSSKQLSFSLPTGGLAGSSVAQSL